MFVVYSIFLVLATVAAATDGHGGHYTPTWAVHIPGGQAVADRTAAAHGFVNLGPIVEDHYHFQHNHVHRRSANPAEHLHGRLLDDERVHWAQQQRTKSRQKRDYMLQQHTRRAAELADQAQITAAVLNNPKLSELWYLNRGNGMDLNVIPVWQQGITGKDVVVSILDDGLEIDHPDLVQNYDPLASADINDNDDDPTPTYDDEDSNRHGTRCAGEVAATANNSLCSVGIAYGARIGGVRMLDGDVTDASEARALSLRPQHIDVYSASWGPDDDGQTVDGPGRLARLALAEGVTKGRGGRGSVYLFSSGNGGNEWDNCNCDGYTNSIWTVSVSAATERGEAPWYSERCSSTLATTYSSGDDDERQITTTDLGHKCTAGHRATSAAAPLAAGIVALVLEANGNVTWRDVQHIVVRTSRSENLVDPTWATNGVGRRVSHSFGYGLMDAAAMVRLAQTWTTVPEQRRCEIYAPNLNATIPSKGAQIFTLDVQHCEGVNFLEHVQANITIAAQSRGELEIYLVSPTGTNVTLLTARLLDTYRYGFKQWPFMSVHSWGENPHGSWQLEVRNTGAMTNGTARITNWGLILYGTETPAQPNDVENGATTVPEISTTPVDG